MSDVGKNIRKFRVQMNMTQEELAQKNPVHADNSFQL